ncbi:MAG: NAD(P)/FAD-dependent oxidoreductase [Deltaproteobacteria bacterium]|jgi:phytoene dehydrogenase-like protein|nr:NAD(P)/FAD-dependent oxidoreductase [Deltaproteobacteria bacterium]MBT4637828.1 NAD(P)/FAD-dependent oxidoreductase [Deltaproteobacteria bacterium]MBT6499334.1 NAD(P)/FAD-dependent oxidoreductase [Deltaproteobacteria bacterium]MBT6613514.1 NAD(P)/FAD-dependent oxidoreductase [Deltaproteobacteria bacterium]MBT7150819.1 NAD(P)/FAD-dependent oxidoreductase [Deltaproteobacteria bacterium]
MADYDAVVIGAGNGGLTAATTLARSGVKTLLLEKHNIPGGCATSFVRGQFEFEVALHQLSGVGTEGFAGPLRGTLSDLGVLDDIELVQMENMYRIVYPGEMDLTLKADRAAAVAELKEHFPTEAEKIDKYFDFLFQYCTEWLSAAILRDPEASPSKYPIYYKYALKPTQLVFDEYGFSPLLQTALNIYWSYVGIPPSRLPYGDFALLMWVYLEFKPWHIKGGSQALSSALLNAFYAAGGEARFNCGAKKVLVNNNSITGVITEAGDEISTGRIVSNAGTYTTYVDLIEAEQVPAERDKELGTRTVGTSAFTLYMGFDREPAELDIHETTNFLVTSTDAEQAYKMTRTLEPPQFTLFSCYDVDDPEFSPQGSCQGAFLTLNYGEPWLSVPPTQYFDTKYRYAERLLKILHAVFPKCKSHVEELEVATPLTHMRYLGHPGGAIYGFDQFAKDSEMFLKRKSPIEGLYHAGAWSGSGGFQPTLMSGMSAAKSIIRSLNHR